MQVVVSKMETTTLAPTPWPIDAAAKGNYFQGKETKKLRFVVYGHTKSNKNKAKSIDCQNEIVYFCL